MLYKRYREESEAARMVCLLLLYINYQRVNNKTTFIKSAQCFATDLQMEEEKALKQLRRTMVPLSRPVPNFNRPFFPEK